MNQISPNAAHPLNSELLKLGPVRAQVNYTRRTDSKPVVYQYAKETDAQPIDALTDPRIVTIANARPFAAELSLDLHGFALRPQVTKVTDFDDPAQRRGIYELEIADLVLAATGGRDVLAFDHTIRRIGHDNGSAQTRAPVRITHNDYTKTSGPQRVRDLLPKGASDAALTRRFSIVNVWRSLNGPILDTPLALADARTVADSDWIATDLKYPDRTGEVYRIAFNPAHRWYYVPQLQADEALLIKSFDSAEDGKARFTPHTAFDDPATLPGTAVRESIESRVLVFY
jgi:hypothetical protein